jgi:H+/Cl- antiporter ClcA
MSKLLNSSKTILLTEIASSRPISFSSEIALFAIEGFIGGIIGATISTLVAKVAYIRRKSELSFINNRFRYAAIITVVIATITFIVDTLRYGDRAIMTFMFSEEENNIKGLTRPVEGIRLFTLFVLKFTITILSLSMNIPSGAFGPLFAIGALYGRLFGHIVKSMFNLSEESIYSMIGASCVFSGASHSVSAALVIFEMTGQTTYLAPLLLATLIANLTGQALAMNIFDVFLVIKNLPHLPTVKSPEMYTLTASDIMTKVHYYLTMDNLTMINCLNLFAN